MTIAQKVLLLALAQVALGLVPGRCVTMTSVPSSARRSMLRSASAGAVMLNLPFQLPSLAVGAPAATNEVVSTVNGIRRKRLGGSDLVVSDLKRQSFVP